ncbi:MAG: type VI secretion system contractile sheath large subunit [Pseudomonadota bacterium]
MTVDLDTGPAQLTASIARVAQLIAKIDELLTLQLDKILHHARFQELESAWRGLEMLTREVPRARRTKICLLDLSWAELRKDLERSIDFDQSGIFWLLHTTEFDMPGGEPFGVVVCNYRVSQRSQADIRALRRLATTAEAAFCVMLFPALPELFGMDQYSDFHPSVRLSELFSQDEYRHWQSLRSLPSSKFLAFVLPSVLMREPWGENGQRRGRFPYKEACHRSDDYLWGNPCFVLAGVLLREFEETGWFSHVRGAPRDTLTGGIASGVLPQRRVDRCDEHFSVLPPEAIVVTDSMERKLSECGFISLAHCWQTALSAFLSLPSVYKLQLEPGAEHADSERIGSQTQNVLCASRFAHYVKVIMRDKVGSFLTAEACEEFLLEWLQEYCVGGENLDWETRARFPLRSAAVTVRDKPASPGYLMCDIALTPHYQYDGLVGELSLTTEFARSSRPGGAATS